MLLGTLHSSMQLPAGAVALLSPWVGDWVKSTILAHRTSHTLKMNMPNCLTEVESLVCRVGPGVDTSTANRCLRQHAVTGQAKGQGHWGLNHNCKKPASMEQMTVLVCTNGWRVLEDSSMYSSNQKLHFVVVFPLLNSIQ